jgi:hypothetical protein
MSGDGSTAAVIATIGLHGSASTWVFNIVRELMIAAVGGGNVVTLYADTVAQLPDESALAGVHLIVKSHHGSPGLDAWLTERRALIILSMRDPRDASISMAQRFRRPLRHTAVWLANDCEHLTRLATSGHLLLRYEDRFFDDVTMVARLASAIRVNVPADVMQAIFDRYRTDAVRKFAASLADLPPERVQMVGDFRMDPVTQILAPHIGDGRDEKWYDLGPRAQVELTQFFGPFLDRFDYPR